MARQQGFSILEVTVAMALLAVLAAALIPAYSGGFVRVAAGKQREAASSLMVQAMEQIRALPFATVANGLDNGEVAASADPRITVAGSTYTFDNGETIPHGDLGYTQEPLNPHRRTVEVGGTDYTISVYPTHYEGSTSILRMTVIVDWLSTQASTASEVRSESVLYSDPTGCISSSTHPFSAPCQPFLYADATSGAGSIVVTPAPGTAGPALGSVNLVRAALDMPSLYSTMQIEQISALNSRVITSGASMEAATTQSTGAVSGVTDVDDDPGASSSASQSVTPVQIAGALTATDGENSITATPGAADTGSTASTISAGASPVCANLSGASILTSKPCSGGSMQMASSAATMSMSLMAGSTSLGATVLGKVGAPPATSRVLASRHTSSDPVLCNGTSGDGCVHAAALRRFGTIDIAGLPATLIANGAAPAGWGDADNNYLIRISNYGDETKSERGVNAAAPSATQIAANGSGTPTISYWNGAGYDSATINWGGSAPSMSIPTVVATDLSIAGGDVVVTIATDIAVGVTSTSSSGPTGCATACIASASVGSPIVADITYTVTHGGSTLASLRVRFDLGSNVSKTNYRAAPSAG